MFKRKYTLIIAVTWFSLITYIESVEAESVKLVQWWDEYFPQKYEKSGISFSYSRTNQLKQYQDFDNDGTSNDTLVCQTFSLVEPYNPYPKCQPDFKNNHNYRIDRPSARFYGGTVAHYTNVSDLTEINKKGEEIPIFRGFTQATVQPTEGGSPNKDYNIGVNRQNLEIGWADITVWPILRDWSPMAKIFNEIPEAKQNFSTVFIWKKEDFVNGSSSEKKLTFDNTSKISVDITRTRENVEECRFVVQDGEQLWISEYTYPVYESSAATIELNPLNSRWAIYTPLECDIEFNREKASFSAHTFEDIQAVGVYFATYHFTHESMGITFDNFQAYATNKPSSELPIEPYVKGNAINAKGEPISTDAKFSRGITINGGTITVDASDQMDIRGVITVDSEHIGKEAEIIVVVGFTPVSSTEESFFMFNQEGEILPWNGNMDDLIAYEKTDLIKQKESDKRVKQDIILMEGRNVQIFPVSLSSFRDKQLDTILLGCEERPLTYSGLLNEVPSGLLRFFFGYRLKENGTIVYNSESINVIVTAN